MRALGLSPSKEETRRMGALYDQVTLPLPLPLALPLALALALALALPLALTLTLALTLNQPCGRRAT